MATEGRLFENSREMLGNGLLTADTDFHLKQRRLMQPAFHQEQIAGWADTISRAPTRPSTPGRAGTTCG
ncbi:hypothetical protein AB0H47_34190 [Streptomyces globisporus]|uniref:hypothetical protein n=1 Tax=Streptomyces globisporus TaxID=1908 RepID=UPI003460D8CF